MYFISKETNCFSSNLFISLFSYMLLWLANKEAVACYCYVLISNFCATFFFSIQATGSLGLKLPYDSYQETILRITEESWMWFYLLFTMDNFYKILYMSTLKMYVENVLTVWLVSRYYVQILRNCLECFTNSELTSTFYMSVQEYPSIKGVSPM